MRTIVVLGGGRLPQGGQTQLSRQRLDRVVELAKSGEADRIVVLGGLRSTYLPNAIEFEASGAAERRDYLRSQGVPPFRIVPLPEGRDTIGEALAFAQWWKQQEQGLLTLLTSTLHVPRAQWIFSKVLGPSVRFDTLGVDCGGILLAEEENDYLQATRSYFAAHPTCLPAEPGHWHSAHPALYAQFKAIHDNHHPPGKESQAYFAVTNADGKGAAAT